MKIAKFFIGVFILTLLVGCTVDTYKLSDGSTYYSINPTESNDRPLAKEEKKVQYKTKCKLRVNAPKGAIVKIMNIKPKYHDNIELKKGKYHIVVAKQGYQKYDKWIVLSDDMTYNVQLKKVVQPTIKENYFKYVKKIDWTYHHEYFSLVYDAKNKLIWGLQSEYVDYVKKNHPKKPVEIAYMTDFNNEYYRKDYYQLNTLVYTGYYRDNKSKYYRFIDNNSIAIYYKSKYNKPSIKKTFGNLTTLKINGMQSSWRIPTLREVKRNNPFKKYQKYFKVRTVFSGGEVRVKDNLPILMTKFRGFGLNGFSWLYQKNNNGLYTIPYKALLRADVDDFNSYYYFTIILPVRKISTKYDKVIFNVQYTPKQKLAYLTSMLTQEALHVSRKKIKKPKKIPHIQPKNLKRGEFEKNQDYQKRVKAYRQKIIEKNKAIDKKNTQLMREYSQAVEAENIRYKKLLKHNQDKKIIAKTANLMAQKAMRMIFGDPKFSDIVYDADKEIFKATLYSSSNNLQMSVKIPVPINKAKKFKANILNDNLIPVVHFSLVNNKLKFHNLEIITNTDKIEQDLAFAKKQDTPKVYRAFLKEYPHYKKRAKVEKLLQNAIEKQAYGYANSLSELKAFVKKYPHSQYAKKAYHDIQRIEAEQKRKAEAYAKKEAAYNSRKKVGDKVCKDGTTSFVLHITMKAFVEKVNGNNIQLRISDTEGTTPYYNGVSLYKNTLIWDRYNNWYKCQ